MARIGLLNRSVSISECPWLKKDLKKNKLVYEYDKFTYECISPTGIAVTNYPDELPFYEVPRDAIDWLNPDGTVSEADKTPSIVDFFESRGIKY